MVHPFHLGACTEGQDDGFAMIINPARSWRQRWHTRSGTRSRWPTGARTCSSPGAGSSATGLATWPVKDETWRSDGAGDPPRHQRRRRACQVHIKAGEQSTQCVTLELARGGSASPFRSPWSPAVWPWRASSTNDLGVSVRGTDGCALPAPVLALVCGDINTHVTERGPLQTHTSAVGCMAR